MLLLLEGQLGDAGQALGDGRAEGGSGVQAGGLDDLRGGFGFDEDAVGAGDSEHVLGVVAGTVEDLGERDVIVEAVRNDVEEGQRRAVQPVTEVRQVV
ncbi:hypothetical protein ACFQVC_02825 [Streptomyces monticola]|uniref:Uncharacterized protein n=1 Tax=Streptomyces monticola TaxID=2666263 RepID=A0ABW2JAY4_9ACTN